MVFRLHSPRNPCYFLPVNCTRSASLPRQPTLAAASWNSQYELPCEAQNILACSVFTASRNAKVCSNALSRCASLPWWTRCCSRIRQSSKTATSHRLSSRMSAAIAPPMRLAPSRKSRAAQITARWATSKGHRKNCGWSLRFSGQAGEK
jgi:hypothetical protein